MKRIALLASIALLGMATANVGAVPVANSDIKVVLNGTPIDFPDQTPIMKNARVLVPLRGVFEKMGATVDWNAAERIITAESDGKTIVLPIGKAFGTVDGTQIPLDQPAIVVRDRAMVPLRFLGETLGATVAWRATDMTVDISK